jgi:transcription-repair coupling factor (superfamily II helicase)
MNVAVTEPAKPSGEQLVPGPGLPAAEPRRAEQQVPAAAVAVHLAKQHLTKNEIRVHLASSYRRAEEIGRALAGLALEIEALVLPPWDCLPYDRASPGREIMVGAWPCCAA